MLPTLHWIACKIHEQVCAGERGFCEVSKSRNGWGIKRIEIAVLFQYISRIPQPGYHGRSTSGGRRKFGAIRSAFERLNHPKPRALNEPSRGCDHATLEAARASMVC
jgi:hypothetical protein